MIDLKNIYLEPTSLVISPTYKCTAKCEQCCLGCNPNIKEKLELEEIKKYIDEAIKSFPSLKILIVTGGECFTLKDELDLIISYATEKGLLTRVVTNAYWAKTEVSAMKRVKSLAEAGLKEINFSTGDEHQKYVPFEYILNAAFASYKVGINTILISIEGHKKARFTSDEAITHPMYSDFIKKEANHNIQIINNVWMPFKKDITIESVNQGNYVACEKCENLFNSIIINPYSHMLSCCGLIAERTPYLKLGSLKEKDIKSLYYQQYSDFIKILIATEGPYKILKYLFEQEGIEETIPQKHMCGYCADLLFNEEARELIIKHYKSKIEEIFIRFKLGNDINNFLNNQNQLV